MGKCSNSSTVPGFRVISSCDPNPCKINGICVLNSLNTSFICNCADGFGGILTDILKVIKKINFYL